jgi:hypothetical protein
MLELFICFVVGCILAAGVDYLLDQHFPDK